MEGLYLGLLATWLLVLGPVRSAIHHRLTGEVGLGYRIPRGATQWWIGLLSALNLVLLIAVPVADRAGLRPIAALDVAPVGVLGVLLVLIGLALSVRGQAAMGSSWRGDVDPDARTALVTTGPFRLVRNPIYLGTAVTAVGLALIMPNAVAAVNAVSTNRPRGTHPG